MACTPVVHDAMHNGIAAGLEGVATQFLLGEKTHPRFRERFISGTNSTFTQRIFLELEKNESRFGNALIDLSRRQARPGLFPLTYQ